MRWETLGLSIVVALVLGCALPPAKAAAPQSRDGGHPVEPASPPSPPPAKTPPDLLEEEAPVTFYPNAKTDTPECQATFADFNRTWTAARACRADLDCAIAIGSCAAARADRRVELEHKLRAIGRCVKMISLLSCSDSRAICFENRCRTRGRLR